MLRAIVDTNVIIAGILSLSRFSSSALFLDALKKRAFILVQSLPCLEELKRMLGLPEIRAEHKWSDARIEVFCEYIRQSSEVVQAPSVTSPSLARDLTDTKFLDLALAGDADYLVTNDRRHLLRLKKIGRTRIVTPHKFMLVLRAASQQ